MLMPNGHDRVARAALTKPASKRMSAMDEQDLDEREPPSWAREPLAWAACLISALPIAVVLVAVGRWLWGPSPAWAAIYPAVFTLWVWRFRPWSLRRWSGRWPPKAGRR